MKMYTVLSTVRHRPILDNINNSITTYMQNSIRRGTMIGGKSIKCTNALLPIVCAVTDHGTVAGRPKANGYGDVCVHVYAFWVHVYGSVGCMYADVGCKSAETFACKVCGCWVQVS